MAELKTLVIGDGLLGKEIVSQTGWNFISRKMNNFDINNLNLIPNGYNLVINCIANTNTYSDDRESHWNINYKFVDDLITYCNINNIKLVHISTDYVYCNSIENVSELDVPVHCNNWYGYTKLLSDGLVQLRANSYLLCRCTHKPMPFPYEKAWIDQIGNFDYVNVIAKLIIDAINKGLVGVYNIGTEVKSIYDLAVKSKPNVESVESPPNFPKNTTMSIIKYNTDIKKPFFSIAIPTYSYNGKGIDFLEHNFNILSNQIFRDFEVVISDHSLDDSIKDLCNKWDYKLNINYIKNEIGRGVISPNINVCLKNCKGKWIKILFQDDYLYNESSLLITSNFINNNKNINWLATKFVHSNDGINTYRDIVPKWSNNMELGMNSIGCPSVITIKNENLIYFDESLNWLMDCEYYRRMYDIHGLPSVIDDITVVNRTSEYRLTHQISERQKEAEFRKVKLMYD